MQMLANENEVFKNAWHEFAPKIHKTIYPYAKEHVVGCSFEELKSLAMTVFLKALRTHQIEHAQFNTYFYTCLKNAICNNHRNTGFYREAYIISYLDSEGEVKCWSRRFSSEAEALACIVANNLEDAEVVKVSIRAKRIPVEMLHDIKPELPVVDEKKHNIEYALSKISFYLPDKVDQELVLAIYRGEQFSDMCQRLEITYWEMKRRLLGIRRAVVRAGRAGAILI